MAVLDAILYSEQKEKKIFLIDCEGIDLISWGKDKKQAKKDLENSFEGSIKDNNGLIERHPTYSVQLFLRKVREGPKKYGKTIKEISDHTVHIHDLSNEESYDSRKHGSVEDYIQKL